MPKRRRKRPTRHNPHSRIVIEIEDRKPSRRPTTPINTIPAKRPPDIAPHPTSYAMVLTPTTCTTCAREWCEVRCWAIHPTLSNRGRIRRPVSHLEYNLPYTTEALPPVLLPTCNYCIRDLKHYLAVLPPAPQNLTPSPPLSWQGQGLAPSAPKPKAEPKPPAPSTAPSYTTAQMLTRLFP